jgi:hypothetical protein
MQTISHQFQQADFYIPTWEVKHLFLGTFNPSGGEAVPYYYGRSKNQLWPLLSKIFGETLDPNAQGFFDLLRKHKIACIDVIDSVTAEEKRMDTITGKGYKDTAIINGKVFRSYNTTAILNSIANNPGVRVYSTWGKGSNLKAWRNEVNQLGPITPLVSPSMAAKVPAGALKFEYMLTDWKSKIRVQ